MIRYIRVVYFSECEQQWYAGACVVFAFAVRKHQIRPSMRIPFCAFFFFFFFFWGGGGWGFFVVVISSLLSNLAIVDYHWISFPYLLP